MNGPDIAYKFGCGRYIQERGALARAGREISRFGKSALIIGDKTTLSLVREKLAASLESAGVKYEWYEHNTFCCREHIPFVEKAVTKGGHDVIVGAGGGTISDFAKLCADKTGLPVVNIPTCSATCAAASSIALIYTPEGRVVCTDRYEREVSAVIADMDILGSQPARLMAAGILDSMAKYVEIRHNRIGKDESSVSPGLKASLLLAELAYRQLEQIAEKACADVKKGELSKEVEDAVYITIALTAVISGLAKGFDQSALAHEFYENVRTYYTKESARALHGEVVAVALPMQYAYYGAFEDAGPLRELMRRLGMPLYLEDIGIPPGEDSINLLKGKLLESRFIDEKNQKAVGALEKAFKYMLKK